MVVGSELARLRFGGRRSSSAGGDGGSCVIQEAMRDVFSAMVEGYKGGDVAMVSRVGDVEIVFLFGLRLHQRLGCD